MTLSLKHAFSSTVAEDSGSGVAGGPVGPTEWNAEHTITAAALSVLGRSGTTSGAIADIAGTADQILRIAAAGASAGFGSIDLSKSAAVGTSRLAFANLTQIAATSVLGVTGSSTADVAGLAGTADQVLRVNSAGTALAFGSIDLSKSGTVGTTRLAFANLTQIAALSVLGVTGSSTADVAGIAGTADQVLRVNSAGTALAFGSIDLAKSGTVGASVLAGANGGTGLSTAAIGDLIYASATTPTWARLADVATGSVLVSGGLNTAPAWSAAITVTTSVTTATLTGSTSLTSPLQIGGSGTTGTQLTIKSTTGNGTTDAIALVGGNNGGTPFATFASALTTLPRPVSITDATASTTASTGALLVTGGVGIGGAVNTGGNITVSNTQPTLTWNKSASTQQNVLFGNTNGLNRWAMLFGGPEAESGANAGSDWSLLRYDDAGAYIAAVWTVKRSTGTMTITSNNASSSTTTGALVVTGGVGIGADLYVATGTNAIAPLTFTSGTNLTTARAGAYEYDGTCHYITSIASARQVATTAQFATVQGTAIALSNSSTSPQNIFASANDVITLAATTAYLFEGILVFTTGATTHTTAIGLVASSAYTSILYWASIHSGATNIAPTSSVVTASTATVLNTTSVATTTVIKISGIVRTNGATTMTPQVTFSAGPTGTCQTEINSWFRIWPLGTNTVAAVGNWA